MTAKAPNILIVMADQMAPAFLPIYGHPLVRAPHMQALARGGVVFDSAYCVSPLCAPSRASFMSGVLPSRTGVYDNAAEFAADIQPSLTPFGFAVIAPFYQARCTSAGPISCMVSSSG